MRAGRLTAGVVLASALALVVAAAPSGARVQRHQVTVVKHGAVRLVAWDSKNKLKGVCFRLRDATEKNAFCDRSGQHKLRLAFTSFVSHDRSTTVVGGIARRGEVTVVATFADGQTLTMHTQRGKRYRGRQRGKARFWAGEKADATLITSVAAKDAMGQTVETISTTPTPIPGPNPPPPCPPCPRPPTQTPEPQAHIACPVRPCPL